MKGKFLFVVGLGVGYVLGARAGRERYEQIRQAAQNVWNQPAVQEGVETVKGFALARVGDVTDTVLDGAKKLVRNVSGTQTTSKSGAKTSSSSTSSSSSAKSTASKKPAAKPASKATAKPAAGSAAKSGSSSSTDS